MHLIAWPRSTAANPLQWPFLVYSALLVVLAIRTHGMTVEALARLRQDTEHLFYHGYENYMAHAFPEDELKPISCEPQTRNRDNPADIGLNDVLGNYSLTLIDSLSTLAILASSDSKKNHQKSLQNFQDGVQSLVQLYGDGSEQLPCGTRACGFDLNSKVQVFETNIRGVGGLLSAHLFAIGDLPIRGYQPVWKTSRGGHKGIEWKNGFVYDGQLLSLAHDLAKRLLPAFSTQTDLPYPRVNLRHGIPFYQTAGDGVCLLDGSSLDTPEITETCTAGAGSLVLEFTTLSRLTGDMRFERLAKRAFWAIWDRRSSIDLVGNGIDAESGQWTMPTLAGVGAGVDSFFEYSLKSHILLSGLPYDPVHHETDAPDRFLAVWEQSHAAVRRHIYRNGRTEKHPYYGQVDPLSGAPRYTWIDNLSAYYPGLLVLAGELDEAIESHLLYSALWTRYSALPERWHATNAYIDPNFRHWVGRPEFIESTFHLYQATKDPFYLHVGEMALGDIRRRCWTRCGWADLGDVTTGEQLDRMESFFLGETAQYLYLLFTEDHPLNKLDRPVVFTTEGHPLLIPDIFRTGDRNPETQRAIRQLERNYTAADASCSVPPPAVALTVSSAVDRPDFFHPAALVQLDEMPVNLSTSSPLMPQSGHGPGLTVEDLQSPTNYTFYPWTLPQNLIPSKGVSSRMANPVISTLTFPNIGSFHANPSEKGTMPIGSLQKIIDGVLINSLSNLRINMVQEPRSIAIPNVDGVMVEIGRDHEYRIQGIANWALGKDEKVILTGEALKGVSPNDPHFTRVKDLEMVDLVVDILATSESEGDIVPSEWKNGILDRYTFDSLRGAVEAMVSHLAYGSESGKDHSQVVTEPSSAGPGGTSHLRSPTSLSRHFIPAILPTGAGAAPLPPITEVDPLPLPAGQLHFKNAFFLDSTLCSHRIPSSIAKTYDVLIIFRGGCSFNDKLANIPSFAPSSEALQLVVVISTLDSQTAHDSGPKEPQKNGEGLIRPLLDLPQLTPNGFERRNPIPMVMVDGSLQNIQTLKMVAKTIGRFDDKGKLLESPKTGASNGDPVHRKADTGLGVKRRYWFESMGVPIGNLVVL